jgi:hypothetical protein
VQFGPYITLLALSVIRQRYTPVLVTLSPTDTVMFFEKVVLFDVLVLGVNVSPLTYCHRYENGAVPPTIVPAEAEEVVTVFDPAPRRVSDPSTNVLPPEIENFCVP